MGLWNQNPVRNTSHYLNRISDKVLIDDGCWLWTGGKTHDGYGQLRNKPENEGIYAHRLFFEIFNGPIPEGYQVDHTCYVPSCVRPDHLEAVTPQENIDRRTERKLACKNGHILTLDNIYWDKNIRVCRTCKLASAKRYQERKRVSLS